MRYTRITTIMLAALLLIPSVGMAQRAYWTQQIDAQTNCIGDGTLEILCFAETGSAVNEVTITNSATGNSPTIASSGEANIGLSLSSQGGGGAVFIVGTVLDLPSAAAPTTDAEGEAAVDLDAWAAGRDAIEFYDGVASTYLLGALVSDTPTNGQVPKWNTGGTITWEADATGGAPAWEDVTDPLAAQTLNMDLDTTTFNWVDTADTSIDAFTMTFDESNAADVNTQRLLVLRRIDGGVGGVMGSLLVIDNADTDDVVTNGIEMSDAGGTITQAFNINDAGITNAFLTPNATISMAELEILDAGTRTDEGLCTYETTGNQFDCAVQTSAGIAAAVSDETGSGLLVFGTSPTIVTPTIAATDWTGANHAHAAANSGGQIAFSDLTGTTTEIEVNLDEMFLLIPASGGPQAELVGANFVQEALAFDPTTDEEVYIRFPIDAGYNDTDIVCDWIWESTNTTLDACFCMDAADAPTGATRDPADEVAAACTSTTVGGTANFLVETTITLTGTFAGGNMFLARLFRDANESETGCAAGSDDLTVDARLLTGSCKYTVNL